MNFTSNPRRLCLIALFAALVIALAVISGCSDDESTVVGVVLGDKVSWVTVENSPTDVVLHDVFFVTNSVGWAVGDDGTILKHVDTGWVAQTSGTNISLRGVFFTDASNGWVIGRNGVHLRTTNGGTTWSVDSTYVICGGGLNPIRRNLNGLDFTSSTSGWVTADNGVLFKWTTDSACANIFYTRDTTIDSNAVDTVIDSTIDTIVYMVDSVDTTVFFPDSIRYDTAWDSTITWNVDITMTPFIDTIITTTDTIPVDKSSGLYLITDKLFADMWGVDFVDAQNGWVVGVFGSIYHTADGGVTWEAQESGTNNTLRSVCFVSATSGWAVGHKGTVLHTTNGGVTWFRQFNNNGIAAHFVDVQFPDANNGWIVATNGSIYRTADGGKSWVVDHEGDNVSLNAASFLDATTGWAVGFEGEIMQGNKK